MKIKTIIAVILLFGLIEPTIKAGFFSKGSRDKPVEIDEKQKELIKFAAQRSRDTHPYVSGKISLEIHNDSEWNISEVKIKITAGNQSRSYIITHYYVSYEKMVDGQPVNPKSNRGFVGKNKTEVWNENVGNFIDKDFSYSIESIKGFED
jgi:hypothetical protein